MAFFDFILTSDWHITDWQPPCRRDNVKNTLTTRLVQFTSSCTARDNPKQVIALLHAGDICHKAKEEPWGITAVTANFNTLADLFEIYAIPGNHDLPQHSLTLYPESALATIAAGTGCEVFLKYTTREINNNLVGFLPFGLQLPSHTEPDILVCHQFTWPGNILEPWPGASSYGQSAQTLLDNLPKSVKLAVTGDNHTSFVHVDEHDETRKVVNPGSLWRYNKDQREHQPKVYFYCSATAEVVAVDIPVELDNVLAPSAAVKQALKLVKKIGEQVEPHADSAIETAAQPALPMLQYENVAAFTDQLKEVALKSRDYLKDLRQTAMGMEDKEAQRWLVKAIEEAEGKKR